MFCVGIFIARPSTWFQSQPALGQKARVTKGLEPAKRPVASPATGKAEAPLVTSPPIRSPDPKKCRRDEPEQEVEPTLADSPESLATSTPGKSEESTTPTAARNLTPEFEAASHEVSCLDCSVF